MTQGPMNQPWNPAQGNPQFQTGPATLAGQPNPFAQPGAEVNPFVNATESVGGDGAYPTNAQLVGRLLVFTVTSFTPQVQGQYGLQDQIIADTAILDGPPMTHKLDGRTLQPTEAFPFPLQAPYIVRGMTWSQKLIVAALKNQVGTGAPVIGRLVKGVKRGSNDAPLKLEPATDAELQGIAMEFWRNRERILAEQTARWESIAQPASFGGPAAGNPFAYPNQPGQYAGLNIPPQGQPAFVGQPMPQAQYGQPAPGSYQPQGPATFSPIQAQETGNGWGTPPQAQPGPAPVQDAPQGWSTQNGPDAGPGTPQPGSWTPEPQGTPAGWPGAQ